MRRIASLVVSLLLLAVASCAHVTATDGSFHFDGLYVFKDPKLDGLKLATTQGGTLSVQDYTSTSKLTGADIAAIAAAVAKAMVVIP